MMINNNMRMFAVLLSEFISDAKVENRGDRQNVLAGSFEKWLVSPIYISCL